MVYKIIFLTSLLLNPLLSLSQNFEWEGYGKGLSYLKIKDGNVAFNGYSWADYEGGKLKEVGEKWIVYEKPKYSSDEPYYGRIQVLNSSFDSLRIWIEGVEVTYYKKEHLDYIGSYIFEEVNVEYLNNYSSFEFKIEFNRHGRIRFSDSENITLFEGQVDETQVDQFKELIKYIDIRNLNISQGWRTVCDDKEFSFIFRDGYREEFKYTAVQVPIQLYPVKEFLEEILKSNGYTITFPNRD